MEVPGCLGLVEHFLDPDMAGAIENPPVDAVSFPTAQNGRAHARENREPSCTVIGILGVDQSHFDGHLIEAQQGFGVHRDHIALHLPGIDDGGTLDFMLQIDRLRIHSRASRSLRRA